MSINVSTILPIMINYYFNFQILINIISMQLICMIIIYFNNSYWLMEFKFWIIPVHSHWTLFQSLRICHSFQLSANNKQTISIAHKLFVISFIADQAPPPFLLPSSSLALLPPSSSPPFRHSPYVVNPAIISNCLLWGRFHH